MRLVTIIAFGCLLLSTAPIHAQSPDQALNDFRAQVLKQRLILQNFSADPITNFQWTANGLASAPPKVRTLGVFTLNSAKLQGNMFLLMGDRSTLFKDKTGKWTLLGNTPITIKIALNGADPAQVLPGLKQQLFFPTVTAALAAIPPSYQRLLSVTAPPPSQLPLPPPPECPAAGAKYLRPEVIHQEEPYFSDEAKQARFSGSVTIVFTVDVTGHTTDLWLAQPAGLGLDNNAAKAVSDYIFKPATCNGATVATPVIVAIGFKIG